jgi:hypothetical protein
MIVIEAANAKAQFDGLMDANAYMTYIKSL